MLPFLSYSILPFLHCSYQVPDAAVLGIGDSLMGPNLGVGAGGGRSDNNDDGHSNSNNNNNKVRNNRTDASAPKVHKRSDVNILLCGDPGAYY